MILGGAALKGIGTKQLFKYLSHCLPTYECNDTQDFSGYVYMVRVEDNVVKTFIKVLSGEMHIRSEIDVGENEKQKIVSIKVPTGSSHLSVESVTTGQIAICTGLNVKPGLFGWEITDALIVLTNGRFDSMGSEPKHFNIAVPLALMRALKNCNERILEPISEYYVVIPKESMSDVTKELSSRNDFYEVISENSDNLTLHGEIPTKMISDFPVAISKLTSGRGIFSSSIIRYTDSAQQNILNEYVGFDPRNEVRFVISEMGGDLDNLDVAVSKRRKSSRSKFKWKSEEKKN